jgi:hypothetical protein
MCQFQEQSQGQKIPVAILGKSAGDVGNIVVSSLVLKFEPVVGPGLSLPVNIKNNGTPHCAQEDSNGDGIPDLVCHFSAGNIILDPANILEKSATVTGEFLVEGTLIAPFIGIPDQVCTLHQQPFCEMTVPF